MVTNDPLVAAVHTRGRSLTRHLRDFAERILHAFGYWFVLRRPGMRLISVSGFQLTIRPTVYDPRWGVAPPYFAKFIDGLDLSGRVIADVGTGSGIQALAAARAGATRVV